MALKLDILANTRQYVNEMKKAGASTEDISDALDELVRQGDDTATNLEHSFRDIARSSDTAGRQVAKNMDDGFDKAKRGAEGFKEEARDTAREAAASFDGSAESIGEVFQEVAANALGDFGPLGAAAGIAIAAGLGTGMAALEKFNEALETARETAFGFAAEADALSKRVDFSASLDSWTQDTERFAQAQDLAKGSGQSLVDVLTALATGGPTLAALRDEFNKNVGATDITVARVAELGGVLKGTTEGFERGAAAAEADAVAMGRYAEQVGVATGATDDLGNKIVKLPDGKEIVIDAVTGQAYEDLDAIERKRLPNKQVAVDMVVNDRAVRDYVPPRKQAYVDYKAAQTAWQ